MSALRGPQIPEYFKEDLFSHLEDDEVAKAEQKAAGRSTSVQADADGLAGAAASEKEPSAIDQVGRKV